MGVKIEVLYTKDTPYGDMLKKIEELAKAKPEELWLVPLPFLERIIETRGLTVIQYAIEDLIKIFLRDDTAALDKNDGIRLAKALSTNVLDQIWLTAHEMCAEPERNLDPTSRMYHREKAQELQDWLNKRSPAKNSVVELNKMTDIIEGSDTGQLAMARAEKNAYVRPVVVRAGEGSEKSDNYIACMAMLRAALMAPSEVISDLPRVMKTLKGRCHPMDGFFIQMYDGTLITNWMQLSKWIDEKGLMPC